ncbi:aminotransferase class I/II-fold pyridoxal phosphate-dependent enzyme [Deinococcus peraridilitoris]|uniref:PLP-dependent enzyme, histidinol-phosphate/aromatic aminotransferase or cobyric acid decarboxylase n=1 Tax=Deinococcus peraridilitoris (strain DSM 19664 / LMG 22246 / CIP 109416 / KR-200) TaxID=937777 RepID=L0A1M5_DEIPD|nr:aminotransferase class I/II-fold pyridoxal phosphate-dependent enzyme [Deinococcus peraridilitoris]AFZ67798.1 PLP-dependent enzyme, histidinol-phosphate/aromatic aminotransferase or cobyric acid decarboxylase [Deinococcus peraridilitoris DSM 19664]
MPEGPQPRHPQLPRAPHGGPGTAPFAGIDFSVNTNPLGPNPVLLAAARAADLGAYPDPGMRAEQEVLAAWHGVSPAEVVPATGASELLHRLARAYLGGHDRVLSVLAPFGEFARAAALQGAALSVVEPEGAREAVHAESPTLVYLCRPHNPLGVSLVAENATALADTCREMGALLILDEAYVGLAPALEPVPPHPALVRLHSPGKLHGLVGVRPAYALAAPEVAAVLVNLAPAWSVGAPTLALLRALPAAQEFVHESLPRWQDAARALKAELRALAPVHDEALPYFTMSVGDARGVTAQLLTRGVKVRDCTSYGFPGRVRISARLPHENARLVQAVSEVLGG